MDVSDWLKDNDLGALVPAFSQKNIDGPRLLSIAPETVNQFQVKV